MNITDPIRRHAQINPQSIAVVRLNGRSVSYRDLDRTIDAVALRALRLGIAPGARADLQLGSPYAQLVFALALARIGAAGVPKSLPREQTAVCFADAAAAGNDDAQMVAVDRGWTELPLTSIDERAAPSHQDGTATCRIFASSGTTGTPKHVAVSHNLMARRVFTKWLSVRAPDDLRLICTISTETNYGFRSALRALWVGGLIVFATTPDLVVSGIRRYGVNTLVISPGSLQSVLSLLPADGDPFPSLTTIEVGGGLLSPRLCEHARQRLCANVVVSYGSTESGNVASAPVTSLASHAGAVGYVVPGVEVQAVDANDAPLPPGTEGILRVRSDNCVDAYFGDPATSAEIFKGGWFYPGDVGAVSPEGLMTLAGRRSELINRGGEKISPRIIEDALLTSEHVLEVAAFGVPDAMGITQIWAAIVPKSPPVNVADLDALCRERLAAAAPKYYLQMNALPRNDAGKVRRDELVRRAVAASEQSPDSFPSR